ncbi:hypothetical protein GUJ93_ZPchr0002g26773 [Zizania palustris]|uniref:Uncharacterized protein n=1 Tax=Zizania palustris TaxID=103762 RepID=A0A8J5V4T2_ZIZPA|nr:hypothetical protein GUJ93_ZPchr0002g26773 [Zizania palustris]
MHGRQGGRSLYLLLRSVLAWRGYDRWVHGFPAAIGVVGCGLNNISVRRRRSPSPSPPNFRPLLGRKRHILVALCTENLDVVGSQDQQEGDGSRYTRLQQFPPSCSLLYSNLQLVYSNFSFSTEKECHPFPLCVSEQIMENRKAYAMEGDFALCKV